MPHKGESTHFEPAAERSSAAERLGIISKQPLGCSSGGKRGDEATVEGLRWLLYCGGGWRKVVRHGETMGDLYQAL